MPSLKEIVKDTVSTFSHYRQGYVYYNVEVGGQLYLFPVSLEDLGQATLLKQHKTIELMRYVRKALEAGSFVRAAGAI